MYKGTLLGKTNLLYSSYALQLTTGYINCGSSERGRNRESKIKGAKEDPKLNSAVRLLYQESPRWHQIDSDCPALKVVCLSLFYILYMRNKNEYVCAYVCI